jgi:hypothetical protein
MTGGSARRGRVFSSFPGRTNNAQQKRHKTQDLCSLLFVAANRHPESLTMHNSEASDHDGSEKKDNDATSGSEGDHPIAKRETVAVGRLKVIVALVLIVSTIAVATIVYKYLSLSEESRFREKFRDDGYKIFTSIGASLDKTFGMLDATSVMLVTHAKETNQTWPFVTMADFGIRVAKLLLLTDVILVTALPVVSPAERRKWEAYSVAHDYWVNDCVSVQKSWDWYRGPLEHHTTKTRAIHDDGIVLPYNHRYNTVVIPAPPVFSFDSRLT